MGKVAFRELGGRAVIVPADPEASRQRATAFRAAVAAVHDALARRYGEAYFAYQDGRYVQDYVTWWELRNWHTKLSRAIARQQHNQRLRALRELADRIAQR